MVRSEYEREEEEKEKKEGGGREGEGRSGVWMTTSGGLTALSVIGISISIRYSISI